MSEVKSSSSKGLKEVKKIWMRGYGRGYRAGQIKGKAEIAKGVIELLDLGEFFEKIDEIKAKKD